MLSVGFAIGPGILAIVGGNGWSPFVVGSACTLAALVPLLIVRKSLPDTTVNAEHTSSRSFLPLAPLLLIGVGVVALSEQATMSLLPVWALAQGFDARSASVMLVVMSVGSIALTFPIGWLADRVSRRRLTAWCAVATSACAGLLVLIGDVNIALWPTLFIFGGMYYAIYVLSLIRLGKRFSGQLLVSGTAAFGAAWGIGGIVGPPLVGGVMTQLGPSGLPVTLAALFGSFVIVNVAWRVSGK